MAVRRKYKYQKDSEEHSRIEKIRDTFLRYWRIIVATLVVITVVLTSYYTYNYIQTRKKEKASIDYANFVETLRTLDKEGIDKEATLKSLEKEAKEIVDEHSGTVFPQLAILNLATAFYENGNYDKAKKYYQMCDDLADDDLIKLSSQWGVADCLYYMGRYEEASNYYLQIKDRFIGDPLLPGVLIRGAECYIKLQKYDDALKLLYLLRAQYPDSAFRQKADDMISRLGG